MNRFSLKIKISALVGCIVLLSACGPSTYVDCAIEASKNPTKIGVHKGLEACAVKFNNGIREY